MGVDRSLTGLRRQAVESVRRYMAEQHPRAKEVRPSEGFSAAWEMRLEVGGTSTVPGTLELPITFPDALPKFYLRKPKIDGAILPHVNPDGFVCTVPEESTFWVDIGQPAQVVSEYLSFVREVLREGVAKENAGDFVAELEAYWDIASRKNRWLSIVPRGIEPGATVEFIKFPEPMLGAYRGLIAGSRESAVDWLGKVFGRNLRVSECESGVYLRSEMSPKPPFPSVACDLHSWLSRRLQPPHRVWAKALGLGRVDVHTLIEFPVPEGRILGAIKIPAMHFDGFRRPPSGYVTDLAPLLRSSDPLELMAVEDVTMERLRYRGGGELEEASPLVGKTVCVVGCGALGSALAVGLARCGLGKLVLVDDDSLAPENTLRHAVGMRGVGKQKVDAVKDLIESDTPGLCVAALNEDALALVERSDWRDGVDLIAVAAANHSVHARICERASAEAWQQSTVIGWIEDYGAAAHALSLPVGSTNVFEDLFVGGCYRYQLAEAAVMGNTIREPGCRGHFLPYTYEATQGAANLMLSAAEKLLGGFGRGAEALVYVGDLERAARQGARFRPEVSRQASHRRLAFRIDGGQ